MATNPNRKSVLQERAARPFVGYYDPATDSIKLDEIGTATFLATLNPAILGVQGARYATFGHSGLARGLTQFSNVSNSGGVTTGVTILGGVATFKYNSGNIQSDAGNVIQVICPTVYRTQVGLGGVPSYNYNTKLLSKTVVSGVTTLTFAAQGLADGYYDNVSSTDQWVLQALTGHNDFDIPYWVEANSGNPSKLTAAYAMGGSLSSEMVRSLVNAATGPKFDRAWIQGSLNDINSLANGASTAVVQDVINTVIANHATVVKALIALGKEPIVIIDHLWTSSFPTDTAVKRAAMAQVRLSLLQFPYIYPGCKVIDALAASISAGKYLNSTYSQSSDGYHLMGNGACALGPYLWAQLSTQTKHSLAVSNPVTLDDDGVLNAMLPGTVYQNILNNPVLTGNTGTKGGTVTGTVPDNWYFDAGAGANVVSTAGQALNVPANEVSNRANQGFGWQLNGSVAANNTAYARVVNMQSKVVAGKWYRTGVNVFVNAQFTGFVGMGLNVFTNGDTNFSGIVALQGSSNLGAGATTEAWPLGKWITIWSDPFFIATVPNALSLYIQFVFGGNGGSMNVQLSAPFFRVEPDPASY